MTPSSRIELLGRLHAVVNGGGHILRFRTRKTAALFAYLALYSDRSHPRELLAELLWPEARLDAGRNSLSQALSSLRREMAVPGEGPQLLSADRNAVQLHVTTDVASFERMIRLPGTAEERVPWLREAVALYRGNLLPGYYEEWIEPERSRLAELFSDACHQLCDLLLKLNDSRGAIEIAFRATSADALSEVAARDLMRARMAANDPRQALNAYHVLEAALLRELDVRPSQQTRELAREISQRSAGDATPPGPRSGLVLTSLLMVDVRQNDATPAWEAARASLRSRVTSCVGVYAGAVDDASSMLVARFSDPVHALHCAVQLRDDLRRASWPDGSPMTPNLRLDTFLEPTRQSTRPRPPGNYHFGRICSGVTPGSIMLSEAHAGLVRPELEPEFVLRDRAGVGDSERCYELVQEVPGKIIQLAV